VNHLRVSTSDWVFVALCRIEDEGEDVPVTALEIAERLELPRHLVGHHLKQRVDTGDVRRIARKSRRADYKPRALGYRSTPEGRRRLDIYRRELALFIKEIEG
jgi:predicted ArsR family transcriptional regulator